MLTGECSINLGSCLSFSFFVLVGVPVGWQFALLWRWRRCKALRDFKSHDSSWVASWSVRSDLSHQVRQLQTLLASIDHGDGGLGQDRPGLFLLQSPALKEHTQLMIWTMTIVLITTIVNVMVHRLLGYKIACVCVLYTHIYVCVCVRTNVYMRVPSDFDALCPIHVVTLSVCSKVLCVCWRSRFEVLSIFG